MLMQELQRMRWCRVSYIFIDATQRVYHADDIYIYAASMAGRADKARFAMKR